ncbi:rRNA maturation RNase YbeY [Thalassospira marina]|uniref:Endoribonuclease YbeY n=1 Tax=Thalassospira marina TaxID=2048283 RepID=A0ABM6QDT2_9PROT|nr:rRNA maturation RNase YbeY [Thalassospira marina]AUG54736.1 rRNA maturation RNase YbeY [Thalassospira marina]
MTALLDLDVAVEAGNWSDSEQEAITGAVKAALLAAAEDGALWDEEDEKSLLDQVGLIEISVTLSDDASVRELNRDYRGKDAPTNVLSFAALESDEDASDFAMAPDMPLMLGDIVIARETCEREALEQNKPLLHHLIHLSVHGTLHLVGYDHMVDDEAEHMEQLERHILAGMGIDDPYAPIEDQDVETGQ